MGLLSRGQAMLNRALKASDGVAVTYARGGQSVALTARVGRTLFAGLTESVAVQWGDRDYLIEAALLVLGGVPTTPQRGDRITETAAGLVFEAASPESGEPCWRYSDQTRTLYRVHAKREP